MLPVIKIKYPEPFGYAFIPKLEFDPAIHELFTEESATVAEKIPTPKRKTKTEEASEEQE